MDEKLIIIDFGSQYTQLIARKVRELNVYSEIHPFNHLPSFEDASIKGIILSGGPSSVLDKEAPSFDFGLVPDHLPLLGICYGAQYLAKVNGGKIAPSEIREYGRAHLVEIQSNPLFKGVDIKSQVWMSHGDTILELPPNFEKIASTEEVNVAAYQASANQWGIQFHPEVYHSTQGKTLLDNFLNQCEFDKSWTPAHYVEEAVALLQNEIGDKKVIMGLSGGVDSTVAAQLIHLAIGKNLFCIFVDNGLLRKNEFSDVLKSYEGMGLNVRGVDARAEFLTALEGLEDPEAKRKAIGGAFIDVFEREAKKIDGAQYLGQGTIYPDIIESVSVKGPSATIKSHHNVGGLPEKMNLKVVEPLRSLFKDEVRRVGKELGIDPLILGRHPFPGPGLGIRIIGDITAEKVAMLQNADHIYIQHLKKSGWYDKIWQAGAILLPIKSVGVMGDERTFEKVLALRAVSSVDGMTADWVHIPYDILANISNDIINKVSGINRVVYDISSKPPATIEWE